MVSWAWRRDWIMDRPAPGRWLRLGILLSGALAVLFAGYVGFRVWSVPDVGPIAKPAAWIGAAGRCHHPIQMRPTSTAKPAVGSSALRLRRTSSAETRHLST